MWLAKINHKLIILDCPIVMIYFIITFKLYLKIDISILIVYGWGKGKHLCQTLNVEINNNTQFYLNDDFRDIKSLHIH